MGSDNSIVINCFAINISNQFHKMLKIRLDLKEDAI